MSRQSCRSTYIHRTSRCWLLTTSELPGTFVPFPLVEVAPHVEIHTDFTTGSNTESIHKILHNLKRQN